MLVTTGKLKGKEVLGLSFLDRQWRRTKTARDQPYDDSGLHWMTNGTQSGLAAASDHSFFSWMHERLQVLASTLSELDLKLAVLKDVLAGRAPRPAPHDASVTIH